MYIYIYNIVSNKFPSPTYRLFRLSGILNGEATFNRLSRRNVSSMLCKDVIQQWNPYFAQHCYPFSFHTRTLLSTWIRKKLIFLHNRESFHSHPVPQLGKNKLSIHSRHCKPPNTGRITHETALNLWTRRQVESIYRERERKTEKHATGILENNRKPKHGPWKTISRI